MLPCLNWATSLETVVTGNNSDRRRRKEQDFGAWHILRNVICSKSHNHLPAVLPFRKLGIRILYYAKTGDTTTCRENSQKNGNPVAPCRENEESPPLST